MDLLDRVSCPIKVGHWMLGQHPDCPPDLSASRRCHLQYDRVQAIEKTYNFCAWLDLALISVTFALHGCSVVSWACSRSLPLPLPLPWREFASLVAVVLEPCVQGFVYKHVISRALDQGIDNKQNTGHCMVLFIAAVLVASLWLSYPSNASVLKGMVDRVDGELRRVNGKVQDVDGEVKRLGRDTSVHGEALDQLLRTVEDLSCRLNQVQQQQKLQQLEQQQLTTPAKRRTRS